MITFFEDVKRHYPKLQLMELFKAIGGEPDTEAYTNFIIKKQQLFDRWYAEDDSSEKRLIGIFLAREIEVMELSEIAILADNIDFFIEKNRYSLFARISKKCRVFETQN